MAAWGYTEEEIRQLEVAGNIYQEVYAAVEEWQMRGEQHPNAMERTKSSVFGKRSKGSKDTTGRKLWRTINTPAEITFKSGEALADNAGGHLVPKAAAVTSVAGPYAIVLRQRQHLIDKVEQLEYQHVKHRRIIDNLYKELAKRTAEQDEACRANGQQ